MPEYEQFNSFPYLKRFCEEEQITLQPFDHTFQRLSLHNIIQTNVPIKLQNNINKRRSLVDCCLCFAYEHNLMNPDRRGKLKANDQNFWSVFGELRVGNWLANLGLFFKEYEPPAIGGKKGDYLITTQSGLDIFIEVKVLSGDRNYCSQSELLSAVADLARQIRPEITGITVENYNYIKGSNTRVLLENIRQFLMSTPLPATFTEPSGSKPNMQIIFSSISGDPFSFGWGGSVGIDDKLRDLLHIPTSTQDYGIQLSQDPIPSVALIYDLEHWASDEIETVLYGTKGINYRNNDGIWDINIPSPLSAVGILKFSLDNPLPSSASIYLSPRAEYPISISACLSPSINFMNIASNGFDISTI